MALLHIYDSSDKGIVLTANVRGSANKLPITDANKLESELLSLISAGSRFSQILFETHGVSGKIFFNGVSINADYWKTCKGRFNSLTTANARIYFNGCNVATGADGWKFLESAAGAFISSGGGEVFGQTSFGIGNPLNGHVVHLWGTTRRLFIDNNGRIVERFEQ